MPRYFLEVSYKGTKYSGFQVQLNASTIQSEMERALQTLFRKKIELTGASRTDTGVHAYQNFFHFDFDETILQKQLYNLNSILPPDIAAKQIYQVDEKAHCRFDAISREYKYFIHQRKNPFLSDRAYYYPFRIDMSVLQQAAEIIKEYNDFKSFSKRNTQAKTSLCTILQSKWYIEEDSIVYNVIANRFLRGMVRGLAGTMLSTARGKINLSNFRQVLESGDNKLADFSAPAHGLFLVSVKYQPQTLLRGI